MLASTAHTLITGWDVAFALLAVLVAFALVKVEPRFPWFAALTLFGVALTLFTLCVKF